MDAFWSVLETHARSQASILAWLREAPEDEIVAFQLTYELAAEALTDYWDGPVVDGVRYSEDDTEDLCMWIVAQGREFWTAARADFGGAVNRYTARDGGDPWTPGAPAYAVYFERFGRSLYERLYES
ncbi:hypothetical protein ABZS66_06040 [Dactylosporangium sp. NPDC005572]|uniref:DUF4240 domain-containing protein n=1 Tax=Dactylosporangium sp. NPDC005572 TaxID=3156889 RepID=UPI0033B6EE44